MKEPEYTQASLLVFRPQVDLFDELKKNRSLYIPEKNDPWPTIYNLSDSLRLNLDRVKSRVEHQSNKRIGDHPVMNAAISLGAQWLSQEKDIDPLLDIRRHFHAIDSSVDDLTARVIQGIFDNFPIALESGKRHTLHMPIDIYRLVSSLSEDSGTTINNICILSMMRSLSILPETIFESGQQMRDTVEEFRKLCKIRYRVMKAVLEEFDL